MPESKINIDLNKKFECEPALEVTEKLPEQKTKSEEKLQEELVHSEVMKLDDETQLSHRTKDSVLFKILPIRLYGKNDIIVEIFAILDSGS